MSKSFTGPHKIKQAHRNFETHQRQDKKMGRAPCCDKNGLKKGPWTPEEDLKLINYIQKHGPGNWRNLPQNAGLQRCGKSCRLRWTNYLRPDIKRGRFSFEEEETIIQLHSVLGNKWSTIAARLPGRTDNEIKNYWNTHIKKRLLRMGIDPVTHTPRLDLLDLSSIIGSSLCNPPSLLNLSALLSTTTTQALFNPDLLRLASTILSLKQENPELLNSLYNNNNLQENQLFNNMHQNQVLPSLQPNLDHQFQNHIQESGFSTDQITPQAPVSADDHQGLSSNNVTSTTKLTTQENITSSTLAENLVADIDLPQSSYFQNLLHYSSKDFSFDSLLSTPSSSPTPLNSSSTTNINSGAEDERESYCSHLLKFEIPESLDISDFL